MCAPAGNAPCRCPWMNRGKNLQVLAGLLLHLPRGLASLDQPDDGAPQRWRHPSGPQRRESTHSATPGCPCRHAQARRARLQG